MCSRAHSPLTTFFLVFRLLVLPTAGSSFVIRPHDSFTDRLSNLVQRRQVTNPAGNALGASLRMLLEGPYGHDIDLKQYESLLFVVGGAERRFSYYCLLP